MLIRKIAILAPAFASIFGANQAEAGCFGKRNCCQATPIVCPPCAPAVNHAPAPMSAIEVPQSTCVVQPSCCSDGAVTSTSPAPQTFSLTDSLGLQRILIEEPAMVTGANGVQSAVTRTREATSSEALRIVNQKIDELNNKIFGNVAPPPTPLEERVKKLEVTPK